MKSLLFDLDTSGELFHAGDRNNPAINNLSEDDDLGVLALF